MINSYVLSLLGLTGFTEFHNPNKLRNLYTEGHRYEETQEILFNQEITFLMLSKAESWHLMIERAILTVLIKSLKGGVIADIISVHSKSLMVLTLQKQSQLTKCKCYS